ncbi:hypothetical protein BGX33_004058 [Mortierella sp. NVP41]|nr:hypothetical protein BGX33_004058 [Mortierella sp. NVP41]
MRLQMDLNEADSAIQNLTLDRPCARFTADEVLQKDFRHSEPMVWSEPSPWPPVGVNPAIAQEINYAV